jgi:hypothetical protein
MEWKQQQQSRQEVQGHVKKVVLSERLVRMNWMGWYTVKEMGAPPSYGTQRCGNDWTEVALPTLAHPMKPAHSPEVAHLMVEMCNLEVTHLDTVHFEKVAVQT